MAAKGAFQEALFGFRELSAALHLLEDRLLTEHDLEVSLLTKSNAQLRLHLDEAGLSPPVTDGTFSPLSPSSSFSPLSPSTPRHRKHSKSRTKERVAASTQPSPQATISTLEEHAASGRPRENGSSLPDLPSQVGPESPRTCSKSPKGGKSVLGKILSKGSRNSDVQSDGKRSSAVSFDCVSKPLPNVVQDHAEGDLAAIHPQEEEEDCPKSNSSECEGSGDHPVVPQKQATQHSNELSNPPKRGSEESNSLSVERPLAERPPAEGPPSDQQVQQSNDRSPSKATVDAAPSSLGLDFARVDEDTEDDEDEESSDDDSESLYCLLQVWDVDSARAAAIMRRASTVGAHRLDRYKTMGIKMKASAVKKDSKRSSSTLDKSKSFIERRLIIHPQSSRRLTWDLFAMVFLSYDLMMIPLSVFDLPESTFLSVMDWVILLYWTSDMYMSCVTGIYVHGRISMDFRLISRKYARSWLGFDIAVVCPEWLTAVAGSGSATTVGLARFLRNARFLRFLRFVRLLRLVKMEKVLKDLKATVNNHATLLCITISQLNLAVLFAIHILACGWYLVGKISSDSWVKAANIHERDFGDRYLYTFQWSMARLHPSSFGQSLALRAIPERVYSIAAFSIALAGGGIFISSITNTMAQLNTLRHAQHRKYHVVREYARSNQISFSLTMRVKKYVEKTINQKLRVQYQVELAQFLPSSLLMDLRFEAWTPLVSLHRFFLTVCRDSPRVIWCLCKDAFVEVTPLSEDIVFTTGDTCRRMLFVALGELDYVLGRVMGAGNRYGNQNDQDHISRGNWLSEASLWTSWQHRGELQASSDSTLLSLSVILFQEISQEHERAWLDMCTYAQRFVLMLNRGGFIHTDFLPTSFTEETFSQVSMNRESMFVKCRSEVSSANSKVRNDGPAFSEMFSSDTFG